MGHKHLHELLTQDQEPFHLKNYIADRRCQLRSALNPRKRRPLVQPTSASTTARNFCINHVCLFSLHDSPDVRKSPFFEFPSPAIKSPNNATVFLHIPSRTAAMLLDAAMRIQKQNKPKPRPDSSRNAGFGLLGSLFKRLKDRRSRIRRREISLSSPTTTRSRKMDVDLNVSHRFSSADWSEKFSDLETSCSSCSVHDSDEIKFACFCSTPSSPFRFSLEKSPSSGHRTPEFLSPAASPTHHLQEEKVIDLEEEDKEQCSPVSVLDPLFEDDEEEHDGIAMDVAAYDLESSFANVQRAKHQLLQKLQRFEKLAKLDMSEEEDGVVPSDVFDVLDVGNHMKRLVSDLIAEESKNKVEREVVVRRVVSRLESWKLVESNTIDMMVELDFRNEKPQGWRRYDEEKIKETGMDIEVAIFGDLTNELAQELVPLTD